jgi:hypothetical protein
MRLIKSILLVFVFISCSKKQNISFEKSDTVFTKVEVNNRRAQNIPGSYTLARADGNEVVKGIRTTVFAKKLGNESGRSAWCSISIKDSDTTWIWFQLGFIQNGRYVFEYYFGIPDEMTIVNPEVAIIMNAYNTFEIKNVLGTNYWETVINGKTILRWNAKNNQGFSAKTGIEYYGSNSRFPTLNFNPALEVLTDAGWVGSKMAFLSERGRFGCEVIGVNNLNMGSDIASTPLFWLW